MPDLSGATSRLNLGTDDRIVCDVMQTGPATCTAPDHLGGAVDQMLRTRLARCVIADGRRYALGL